MKLLIDRGYTVLFTPGNHDAFDWVNKPGDIKLFVEQMQTIQSWGVKILGGNYIDKTPLMDSLLSFSYPLKTVDTTPHVVGLTLDRLFKQSNLYEEEARKLFGGVEGYQKALDRILPELSRQGVVSVILGIHENNRRVSNLFKERDFEKSFGIRIPLAMAAHDHLVATYYQQGKDGGRTMISDAGSYGSFSVIDVLKNGEVSEALTHVAISSKTFMSVINKDIFHIGQVVRNKVTEADIEDSWLKEYYEKIQSYLLSSRSQLYRTLVILENDVNETKFHLQRGRSHLGDMVAEAMARWGRSVIPIPGKKQKQSVIAMYNSSSYRLEEPLLKGPLTELNIREIYPYNLSATLYRMRGEDIERLYFSLREDYIQRKNENSYSPQINPGFREFNGRLQVKTKEGWMDMKRSKKYYLALDPWLSLHRFGRSYKIKEWGILEGMKPMAFKPMSDILVRFFPPVLKENDRRVSRSKNRGRKKRKNSLNPPSVRGYPDFQMGKKNKRKGSMGMALGCETLFYKK